MNKLVGGFLAISSLGAFLGAREVYQKATSRHFSNYGDTLYEGSARGSFRTIIFPIKTMICIPKIWEEEYRKISSLK